MNIKFVPVAQVVVAALFMFAISAITPNYNIISSYNSMIFAALALLGVILVALGGKEFRKHDTTVNPIDPTQTASLVTSGIYQYTRNPMYVGFVLVLLGFAVYLGSVLSLVVIALFIWSISTYQIIPEEQALEAKFGEVFVEYKKKVRRWV